MLKIAPELRDKGLSGTEIWLEYESWFKGWTKRLREKYVNFFFRHVTLGELGCSLSHLELWEDVVRCGISYQIVFEDDARPPISTRSLYKI